MTRQEILEEITRFYLRSGDFNGKPLRDLVHSQDRVAVVGEVAALVNDGLVAPVIGDGHPNPHIRALPEFHSPQKQIELLTSANAHTCLYPLPKHLEQVVNRDEYIGRPYKLELALGSPQLVHRAFDLSVLEVYRNDPQYHYDTDDIHGSLSVRSDTSLAEAHQVFLQTFGFAYDDQLNKYVAVFVKYLSLLSPEHQQLWNMRETLTKTRLHPDYFRTSILGEFPEHVSVYQALVEELQVINQMATAMGRTRLFREDYRDRSRPRGLASLLRPTLREFNSFVLLLDQLISENFDKSFFRGEVPDFEKINHDDGSFERPPVGTIRMLEQWISKRSRIRESEPIKEMFSAFREVRKLRQTPAHREREDEFDNDFVHRQRAIVNRAYGGVRTLRQMLANHPAAKTVEVPELIFEGKIWTL